MKFVKTFILVLLSFIVISCGTIDTWISPNLIDKNNVKVAFLGLDVREILSNEYSSNIDNQFSDSLQLYFLKAGYSIVERKKIDKILDEIAFQNKAITVEDDPVEIGRILNVEYIVYGTANYDITLNDPFIRQCTIKMIKVETGNTVLVSNWQGSGLHIGQVAKKMGEDIYAKIVKNK